MRALSLLRDGPAYRRERFAEGLQAAGYKLCQTLSDPRPEDVLVSWNRYGANHDLACAFERAKAQVLIVENSYLADYIPAKWHAMSRNHHGGAGVWNTGNSERWDKLGVKLLPWRSGGNETVIFAQRSIGAPMLASPPMWAEETRNKIGGRIRRHPHRNADAIPLDDDLRNARQVITWSSAAGLRALMLGIPCWAAAPWWIGAEACRPLGEWGAEPKRDDAARLAMFRRLIWAQATVDEIETGAAFRRLLG